MIDWFRSWSKGIVIAVIIASLIEMILPENNSKKYIKVIIGIFIVYTIIAPAITSFSDKDVDEFISSNKIIETSTSAYNTEKKSSTYTGQYIKNIYIKNLQNDIEQKLKNKGYIADKVAVNIHDDESYAINNISISICGKENVSDSKKHAESIVDTIKKITIKIDENSNKNNEILSESEKSTIKDYLSETYDIAKEQIQISSINGGDNN